MDSVWIPASVPLGVNQRVMRVRHQMKEAPPKGSGFCGNGSPMQVGLGYTSRDFCDGQSLASPGRWLPDDRKFRRQIGGWVL